jgi:hypothetical protein
MYAESAIASIPTTEYASATFWDLSDILTFTEVIMENRTELSTDATSPLSESVTDQELPVENSTDPENAKKERTLWDRFESVLPAIGWALVMLGVGLSILWPKIPFSDRTKVLVILSLVFLLILVGISIIGRKSRTFRVIGNAIIVLLIVIGAAICSILLTLDNQTQIFKTFGILYFSLLPAWLYLQFIATKGQTLWDEYVLNLFRLDIDKPANLPEPPKRSAFYSAWVKAAPERKNTGDQEKSIYKKKYESLFGAVPDPKSDSSAVFRGENLWPVAIATTIISIGWVLVVKPESIFNMSFLPEGFQSSGLPRIPSEAFRFAFLGAYFYLLQMLVRRYFQNDLKTSAYVNATMRIIISVLLVWTLDSLFHGRFTEAQRSGAAFVIGVFPQVGWQAIQSLIKLPLKPLVPSLSQKYPLSDLDGLNSWYESRLLEEGIEDMQNLATANLVDVMLNTRIPIERLVDWVDQSLLYLHLDNAKDKKNKGGNGERARLRRYGVRTATDLEDVFKAKAMYSDTPTSRDEFIKQFERVLNDGPADAASVVLSILATLKNEPNLYHVRQWKSFADRTLATKPDSEASRDNTLLEPSPKLIPQTS